MSLASFELRVSIPRDPRMALTAGALACHAAEAAGCAERDARAFARRVEAAVLRCVEQPGRGGARVPIVLRRAEGPVEAVVAGRALSVEVGET